MVHKFSVKEIVDTWELVMKGLRQVSPISEEDEKILFNNSLLGVSQLWAGFNDDNKKLPVFFAFTTFGTPVSTGTKILFISHLFSVSEVTIPKEVWKSAFVTIVKFATENKCKRIDCITSNPFVHSLLKELSTEVEENVYLTIKI